MKKSTIKLMIIAILFCLTIFIMQLSVYATNENVEIVEKASGEYVIYVKDNLSKDFEFAFSNDENADKTALTYYSAETDSTDSNANKVAFVNSTTISLFTNPTYMWVKDSEGKYVMNATRIDLKDSIQDGSLNAAADITKIISTDITKNDITKENVNGATVTTIVGKVILNDDEYEKYSYILVKVPNTGEYNELINLATKISKFNDNTNIYTKINVYKEFIKLYDLLKPNFDNEDWIKVQGKEILQPKDAEDGQQYVLWIKGEKNREEIVDAQFLTATKKYSEEKIMETIKTKLPITYDNNTLLVVLAVLIVVSIIVFIRIKILENKKVK